jgi:hypothetical protein
VRAESCSACHSDLELEEIDWAVHNRLPLYGAVPAWGGYYRRPWWYDGGWYWHPPGDGGGGGGGGEPVGERRQVGESPENDRPIVPRPGTVPGTQAVPQPSQATDKPPAKRSGEQAEAPGSRSGGQTAAPEPKRDAGPEQRKQGDSTRNDREPTRRPRP